MVWMQFLWPFMVKEEAVGSYKVPIGMLQHVPFCQFQLSLLHTCHAVLFFKAGDAVLKVEAMLI